MPNSASREGSAPMPWAGLSCLGVAAAGWAAAGPLGLERLLGGAWSWVQGAGIAFLVAGAWRLGRVCRSGRRACACACTGTAWPAPPDDRS